jgi:hypothetical protein
LKLKQILATLVGSATLLAVSGASAAPYILVAHHQRSSGGTLSALLFKAGAAQGCPGPTYTQPCYNTSGSAAPGAVFVTNNGVGTDVIAAGQPTWDWNGTTMTMTGLHWASSAIDSNSNGSVVISDRVTNLVINTGASTTSAGTYSCVEGTFLATVGANGCLNVELGVNAALNTTVTYNVGGAANCVDRTVGGDDVDTGNVRGLDNTAAGGGCDDTDGGFLQYNVVANPRFLILANDTEVKGSDGCYMFGRAGNTPGPSPCVADITTANLAGDYLIFAPAVDTDGDGVVDALDNCRLISNANQVDSNGDGYGNRCDADLNNNGSVNAFDTPLYRAQLGQPSVPPLYNIADFNTNGSVNAFDTPIYRSLLGSPPGPSGLCVNSSNVPVFPCPAHP